MFDLIFDKVDLLLREVESSYMMWHTSSWMRKSLEKLDIGFPERMESDVPIQYRHSQQVQTARDQAHVA
jgi:hypothetical protein